MNTVVLLQNINVVLIGSYYFDDMILIKR